MRRIGATLLLVFFALADQAHACAVCWGGASDSSMIDGAKMSILFMAILIYTVLTGFIAGIVVISRRGASASALVTEAGSNEEEN